VAHPLIDEYIDKRFERGYTLYFARKSGAWVIMSIIDRPISIKISWERERERERERV